MAPVSSPCIKICVIHPESQLCLGCGRTLDEISHWSALPEPERLRIMAELHDRLEELVPDAASDVRA